MEKPWLSIIIPVYNPPFKLFQQCLNSLGKLSVETEIIIIDDGSEDKIGVFCKQFLDSRIRYFHQENQGVSCARNNGIEKAKGDYIFFLDSDDTIPESWCQFINKNYKVMKADWILFNMTDYYPDTGEKCERDILKNDNEIIRKEEFASYIVPSNYFPESCGKLIKREFLNQHSIRVPVGIIQGEDSIFNKKIAMHMNYAQTFSCSSYVYNLILQNQSRIIKKPDDFIKLIQMMYASDKEYINYIVPLDNQETFYKMAKANMIWFCGSSIIKFYKVKQLTKDRQQILKRWINKELLCGISIRDIKRTVGKMYYLFFKANMWIGFKIASYIKRY